MLSVIKLLTYKLLIMEHKTVHEKSDFPLRWKCQAICLVIFQLVINACKEQNAWN